jgi:hypothetical protein
MTDYHRLNSSGIVIIKATTVKGNLHKSTFKYKSERQ